MKIAINPSLPHPSAVIPAGVIRRTRINSGAGHIFKLIHVGWRSVCAHWEGRTCVQTWARFTTTGGAELLQTTWNA